MLKACIKEERIPVFFSVFVFFFQPILAPKKTEAKSAGALLAGFGAAIINSRFVVPKTNVMSHFVLNLFKHYVGN